MPSSVLERFIVWKNTSTESRRFEYHRGFLPRDVMSNEVAEINSAVLDAYMAGTFELAQQRHGDFDFSYLIIRRYIRDALPRRWLIGREAGLIRGFGQRGSKEAREA